MKSLIKNTFILTLTCFILVSATMTLLAATSSNYYSSWTLNISQKPIGGTGTATSSEFFPHTCSEEDTHMHIGITYYYYSDEDSMDLIQGRVSSNCENSDSLSCSFNTPLGTVLSHARSTHGFDLYCESHYSNQILDESID